MGEENQWYTNKELFEQINDLRMEMKETRTVIKKYNGLREEIGAVKEKVEKMEAETDGKTKVFDTFRQWGGWIVAALAMIAAYARLLI